jgi:putative Mg2+ transporter-C (MgtC) family protein
MLSWQDITLRLFMALVYGACIGIERQWHQRSAGFRTTILVAVGSAGFTMFGEMGLHEQTMPRVVAQIVSGIGFLGAGAIMREGLNVRGLNTAATIWCSAAVGIFSGAGFWLAGLILSFFVMLTNIVLRPLVPLINNRLLAKAEENQHFYYLFEVVCSSSDEIQARATILQSLNNQAAVLKAMETTEHVDPDAIIDDGQNVQHNVLISAIFKASFQQDDFFDQLVGRLLLEPKVSVARWRLLSQYQE